MSKGIEALRISKASAGEAPNLPPQSGPSYRSLTVRSLVDPTRERVHALHRDSALGRRGYTATRPPERPARWYCLTAAFMVESPSVACLVRLPITSLPRESTNSS